jgi:hypothetical protein
MSGSERPEEKSKSKVIPKDTNAEAKWYHCAQVHQMNKGAFFLAKGNS